MPLMADYSAFFEEYGALLQQAELYALESNPTFGISDFVGAPLHALIVRLSPFRDVERSTPHLFLAQAVRRAQPGAYVDFAFFPPRHDRERLEAAQVPLLTGVRSCRSAEDFDLILVSNAYTLELINLPYLLLRSGIPVLASERGADLPPILLGGSNAMATQSVLTGDGDAFADALFVGEGERAVERMVALLAEHAALPKRERLLRAAGEVAGLWVANGPPDQRVRKAVCAAPTSDDLLTGYPLLNGEEASTARLQINFGCPAFCSFCFEGYERKPYRELSLDEVLRAALALKRNQGPEAVDLYSFNFNTHAEILDLILELNRRFDRVHLKSQRVDVLATVPGLLEAEVLADKRSFTLGIEGISRGMRAFLHKSLSDAEIDGVLARLMREKIREIKFFYILTGHESDDDLEEFRGFVRALKALRARSRRGVRIVFSFGLLVRMPFTPLRYDRLFLDEVPWRQIDGPVKAACETNGFEFRLATPWDEYAASQVLAMGGTWLHEPVLELARAGHCYDLALTEGYWEALRAWLEENGYWTEAFLGEKMPGYPFALEFVETDLTRDYLYRQYEQAIQGVDEGYCLGRRCLACGACCTPEERQALTDHAIAPAEFGYLRTLGETVRSKWQLKPRYARLWLPPQVAGALAPWRNAWAMRSLLRAYPEQVENLLAAQEALFSCAAHRDHFDLGLYGETVFALKAWDAGGLQAALSEAIADAGVLLPSGIQILELLERFDPEALERITLALSLPSAHFPEAGQHLRDFLHAAYVPANVRRVGGDGAPPAYRFDLSEKVLKKRVIFSGEYAQDGALFHAHLVVSPKFDLIGFLRSFDAPDRYREARVEVLALAFGGDR